MDNLRLLERIGNGDKNAFDKMVSDNMGLVNRIASGFTGRGCEKEDLIQIGAIGLIKAIKNFDTGFNVRFSTYAVPLISGEIRRFLRDDGIVKISRTVKTAAAKGRAAESRLRQKLGYDPDIEEISKESGIGKEELIYAFEACSGCESLNELLYDSGNEKGDRLCSEPYEEDVINKIWIKEALNILSPKERQVIVLRYMKDMTQTKISELVGVSQVQVSRIEKKALEKIRNNSCDVKQSGF